jgi:hypothetical protein
VIEAYADAGLELIDTGNLPVASLAHVERAYPELRRVAESKQAVRDRLGFRGLDELGLEGDGPWQIALPGYLFHSCDQNSSIDTFRTLVVTTVDLALFPLAD